MLSFAKKCGIGDSLIRKYLNGGMPGLDKTVQIASACGVNLQWLATGEGPMHPGEERGVCSDDFISISRADVRLAAGGGSWNGDNLLVLDEIPFTREFLRRRLGRSNIDGLVILTADGDSMDPLIADGDLVMVDRNRDTLSDGIYAFVFAGMARVKRLRPTILGDIEVISENPIYKDELLKRSDLEDFHIIGKVVWCGHHFS
nr:S24 family peptidase [Pseudovibrio sp. Ad37]